MADAFALVGALMLGYWTWKAWAFALRWWEAFFARHAAQQREAEQERERQAELEREEWRIIARAVGRYDASRARFATWTASPLTSWSSTDDGVPRVLVSVAPRLRRRYPHTRFAARMCILFVHAACLASFLFVYACTARLAAWGR